MHVKKFCNKKKINVIWRGPNKSYHEEQLFDVLKYAYSTLNFKPKYSIEHAINEIIMSFKKKLIRESFDNDNFFNIRTLKKNRIK